MELHVIVYIVLSQEMLKYSKNCEGAEDLQEALMSILGILKAVNDSMHQIAITGYDVSGDILKYHYLEAHNKRTYMLHVR